MRISDWSSDVCSSDLGSGGWGSVPANRRRISARTRARNVAKISAEHARQEAVPARRADLADIVAAVAHAGLGLERLDRVRRRLGAGRAHRSEEHTSELQSLMRHSYAVFCLKKKK